ncbi:hypothetical protein F5050DRAFT_1497415 [Lentinula boryana]|uniref:Uncharacterized protein n=1 Tax=Lentinula boryana TaxID=40481 RepID=A0ABQ8QEU8_9AGAR|nr:hypothetical protein F5050DRAFT_1497415 [Lentinula boryana]
MPIRLLGLSNLYVIVYWSIRITLTRSLTLSKLSLNGERAHCNSPRLNTKDGYGQYRRTQRTIYPDKAFKSLKSFYPMLSESCGL